MSYQNKIETYYTISKIYYNNISLIVYDKVAASGAIIS